MTPQTGSWHCFHFLFLLCTLHLSPMLAYFLNDCTILYSDNINDGVSVECKNIGLNSMPVDIPREVISLSLQHNCLTKIYRADFYYLSNLTDLELSDNFISHVDDWTFVHLMELKVLRMNANQLKNLTDNLFQGLAKLVLLSLDENYIQFISPAAFQSLTSLQELNLKSNQIHQMTDIITILKLPRLQVLTISIDELVSFQSKDLPLNMSSELRELSVKSESIKKFSITTAVFPHLETIDLSECCNVLDGWEWDIPDKYYLKNITKVYFSNHISHITIKKSLQSLGSLKYLQLSFPALGIDRDILNTACKIPTLRTLNLHVVHIPSLPTEILSLCTQITDLDLSDNLLIELSTDSLKQMKQLSHLNLTRNHLSKVPDDVKNLSMLQILDLHDNSIYELSCLDFLNLTRLTHLHLDKNYIAVLLPCVFQHLNELKVLTMNDNSIQTFDMFTGLQKLDSLNLKFNSIGQPFMYWNITSLKSLKHLDMVSNAIVGVGQAFDGLDVLETLSLILIYDMDGLSLKSLKSLTIQTCIEHPLTKYVTPQLKTLILRNSNLPDLYPEEIDSRPYLEVLDLSNNKLTSLDFLARDNLTRLSWLDVSQNELTAINVSVFRFLPALRYVNMSENPFACDCTNSDFHQWVLNNNQTQVVGANYYTCAYPLAKRGTRFLDFDIHSCWMDASFICYVSSTCAIMLTLLTSFTYHFLRLHLLYAYYLFLAFLYDAKERKRGSPQHYDAFISYNVHDELWVYREMLPVLEGEQGWRLCLHHRDFLPGKPIIENITDAIYGSRKTICVISHHYLESEWCSREIQMASYRLFDEKKDVLILVFLEDIPAHQLSPYYHMRRLVKKHTYLSWPQAGQHPGLFWQNLRRALDTPHTDLNIDI